MSRRIINVRGTNGSGKSWVVKQLIDRFRYEHCGNYLYFPTLKLYIIGRYFRKNVLIPTGGCDQLKIGEVDSMIAELSEKGNVLFEGAKESRTFNRWTKYKDAEYVYLNTSLEDCINQRTKRRNGKGVDYGDDELIKGFEQTTWVMRKMLDNGFKVYHVSSKDCVELVVNMLMKARAFRIELSELSGSGKRTHTKRCGLYSTHPLFPDMYGVRDTEKRFTDFGIENLSGSVLDIGSNVGAVSFQALKLGASSLRGFEFSWERVELCNTLARIEGCNASFAQVDLRQFRPNVEADYVFCCSVDEYIDDVQDFYRYLRSSTLKTMFFESNVQRGQSVEETVDMLEQAGFDDINYLGNGDDGGISRRRKLFICKI